MTPGTRPYNEAALCRALSHDPSEHWVLCRLYTGRNRLQTVLYNTNRHIGVQLTGWFKFQRGQIWMHDCPVQWRSGAALQAAEDWVQRHAHLDLVGVPEK